MVRNTPSSLISQVVRRLGVWVRRQVNQMVRQLFCRSDGQVTRLGVQWISWLDSQGQKFGKLVYGQEFGPTNRLGIRLGSLISQSFIRLGVRQIDGQVYAQEFGQLVGQTVRYVVRSLVSWLVRRLGIWLGVWLVGQTVRYMVRSLVSWLVRRLGIRLGVR